MIDSVISLNCSCDHKKTKKSMIKKSLNGLILLDISNLYGNVASEIPAKSAPISSENHIISIKEANNKHHASEKMSKNSCDLTTEAIRRGSIYFVSPMIPIPTANILSINVALNHRRLISTHHTGSDDNTINSIIAMISCTISIPIEIFPYNSSSTPLSLNNFTMMMVLLNANAMAIYILVTQSNHNPNAIRHPIKVVNTT